MGQSRQNEENWNEPDKFIFFRTYLAWRWSLQPVAVIFLSPSRPLSPARTSLFAFPECNGAFQFHLFLNEIYVVPCAVFPPLPITMLYRALTIDGQVWRSYDVLHFQWLGHSYFYIFRVDPELGRHPTNPQQSAFRPREHYNRTRQLIFVMIEEVVANFCRNISFWQKKASFFTRSQD